MARGTFLNSFSSSKSCGRCPVGKKKKSWVHDCQRDWIHRGSDFWKNPDFYSILWPIIEVREQMMWWLGLVLKRPSHITCFGTEIIQRAITGTHCWLSFVASLLPKTSSHAKVNQVCPLLSHVTVSSLLHKTSSHQTINHALSYAIMLLTHVCTWHTCLPLQGYQNYPTEQSKVPADSGITHYYALPWKILQNHDFLLKLWFPF